MATTYVGMGFLYLNETRILGIKYVFCALFVIWATDSGAYFIGKAFGKRKLWPEISPNKTIEGSLGGIVCGIVVHLFTIYSSQLKPECRSFNRSDDYHFYFWTNW